jgi:anaerobic magnesium-protoporphyrin IX monomethyl ester cyclase
MKVTLVYPYVRDVYHKLGFVLPPLGLGYLAAVARRDGHEVTIVDMSLTEGKGPVDFRASDLVGISLDTSRYNSAVAVARDAISAGATVVMGGPHATFVADEILTQGLSHYIVRGEGEDSFGELLGRLSSGRDVREVAGLSYVDGGRVIHNPDRPPPSDLDAVPFPARDLIGMERYKRLRLGGRYITSLVTSRGCPFGCDFCSSTVFSGSKWRSRSPINVVGEIESLVKDFGFSAVSFMDDNFTMSPVRVIEIADEIERRGLDIYWWCFSRGDIIVKNEEMVGRMARSGCRYVFMGIESASDPILLGYGKKMKGTDSVRAIELLREYGIETMGSFIIGWPEETKSMVKETIRLAKRIGLGGAQFSILTPYPGTALFARLGDRIFERDWEKYDCFHSVMTLDRIKPAELERLLKRAFFSFYFTPGRIVTALLSPFRGRGVGLSTIKDIWKFFRRK